MRWLSRLARRFGFPRALALALLLALGLLRIADPAPLEELRLRAFDFFQVLHPRAAPQPPPVAIVDIDEASLRKFGQWPWPRTRIAEMVTRLTQAGALVIAFDVIFAEPDRLSPDVVAEVFSGLDEETRYKIKASTSTDSVLANAIRRSRVVLGETGLPIPVPRPDAAPAGASVITAGPDPRPFLVTFAGLLKNLPILDQAAMGRGLFSIRSERDGIVRRVPLVMIAQGEIKPALSLEMLRLVAGGGNILIRSDVAGVRSVAVRGFELPTDRHGQLWIHFAQRNASRFVSAADVLEGRVGPAQVGRKLVMIGTSAAGLLDLKTTPVDPSMPGVEVHAQVLESMLTKAMLTSPNYAIGAELVAAVVIGGLIIWIAPILSPFLLLLFGAAMSALLIGTSWYLYTQQKLLIDATYPLLSSILIYLTLVFTNYIGEQAQRRRIRSAFSQYLSPALVAQLAQSPEKLVLGGEQRKMTIMFSDVRGFTTISEVYKNDPQGLTSLMNSFLTPLTNAIIDRKGTIDKYMGDAIMAFWNAPLDDPSHEINACEAAIDMLDRVETLNQTRKQEAEGSGKPFLPINIGVGINTGECVVGNMGSDLRFDYSVLGDSVNLASRLEGQCKSYGLPIIVGSQTASVAKDRFAVLEIDFVAVKGKKEPEVVYAIMGRDDLAKSGRFQRWRDLSIEMLSHYRRRDWAAALTCIERGRSLDEEGRFTTLYDVYTKRIREFEVTPPPDDWDGAYALDTK
jgi:adenylate cyclase